MVVHGAHQAHDGDEQQEDAHGDHPANDVDAGHQAEALPPCCYTNQEQPHQLEKGRRVGRYVRSS